MIPETSTPVACQQSDVEKFIFERSMVPILKERGRMSVNDFNWCLPGGHLRGAPQKALLQMLKRV